MAEHPAGVVSKICGNGGKKEFGFPFDKGAQFCFHPHNPKKAGSGVRSLPKTQTTHLRISHRRSILCGLACGAFCMFSLIAGLKVNADQSCSYPDSYPYPSADYNQADRWLFFFRECTSYVAWKMNNDAGTTAEPYFFSNYMRGGHFGDA